ncbi:MAG TPA: amino acid transporter [Trichormus sp.]
MTPTIIYSSLTEKPEKRLIQPPMDDTTKNLPTTKQFRSWFFEGMKPSAKMRDERAPWYSVMCLTGLDYFGSLGYAPGIAALSAGLLAPQATIVLVLLTIFGALPMYKRVAEKSPYGQGSISMLERLVPGWAGKALILILIGFAATDFIITITLSAADAAAHIAENNFVQQLCAQDHSWLFLENRMGVTMTLLVVLAMVFLLGFKEAVRVAVVVVFSYLLLNVGVSAIGCWEVIRRPQDWSNWQAQLFTMYKTPWHMGLQSLIVFPSLALGLSGFETGVTVMPIVKGDPDDTQEKPTGRIRNTKKLLTTAAVIMCTFLLISSFMCTILIPQSEFQAGGAANGRALAYIAHLYLGSGYGTCYDISTIFILWFSGASSMAGLLSLVPRYLPRFGMAPDWARATRPLVLFFALVSFVVTYLFKADVDAQGGAYATGVLVLMSSAAVAVFLSLAKTQYLTRVIYFCISSIFLYTTVMNVWQRPEGLHIACFFILSIFTISFISRAVRSTELRTRKIMFDETAQKIVERFNGKTTHIVAHTPGTHDYKECEGRARRLHYLSVEDAPELVFLEITISDASEFEEQALSIHGFEENGYFVFRCTSAAVPNAIASILIAIRNKSGQIPHAFLYWTEGNPLFYSLKYLFLGVGETGPITREILREAEPDIARRPRIHVV